LAPVVVNIIIGGDVDEEDAEEEAEDDEDEVRVVCCSFRFTLSSRLDGRLRLDRVAGKIRFKSLKLLFLIMLALSWPQLVMAADDEATEEVVLRSSVN
jgi:hypothetical protein